MKRIVIAGIAVLALTGYVLAQVTLLGNCGANITGIQLSTGNIYCVAPPGGCAGTGFDFTLSCNSQYLAAF